MEEVTALKGQPNGWAVKNSKSLSHALRHNQQLKLGKFLEASIEQLDEFTSLRPFRWEPRKFFASLMANSKGRFQTWIAPMACSFSRFLDWDFSIGISAIHGHSRMPEQVADIAQGERLTAQRASELGFIFHASENHNYDSIKRDGLLLRATRQGWQRHRKAIHFVYAGGSVSPGPGTMVRYGGNIFYAQLDIGTFFNHGHELFLTDNGVVLCYHDAAPMYLTFHYRPPHEQDPGGLKHEERQRAAGAPPLRRQLHRLLQTLRVRQKAMPKKKAKAKASTDAGSSSTGGSPSGEVPTVDEASLRRLIREDELREAGDTVHGRVDATRLQQEEELRDIIRKARYNPWHFFHHGLLHRKEDSSGNKMYAPYGDALVKTTPFSSLPTDTRKLLGSEYNWASWLSHPLSGYGVHFFLKGFELGKMQGNILNELSLKGKAYSEGYKSPFDHGPGNDVTTILQELNQAQHREFAPSYSDIGFKIPEDSDPRSKKPKQDDPDYATKLKLHEAFCLERDVWVELHAIRADFSTVVSAVSQPYGQDFFSYVQKHWQNLEVRRKYKIQTPEKHTLCDSSRSPGTRLWSLRRWTSSSERWVWAPLLRPAKKAHADLISYKNLRAQRAREIDELCTRPFDDIVVEEFISNLPGPTIEEIDEPMEPASGPADPGEMAGETKQEPDSSAPMDTDAPEGSSFEEGSGVKVEKEEQTTFEPVADPDDERMDDAGATGDHATGSSPSGEVPMPDLNFSADASNDHDNLYEQGIWGKTKTRVEPGAFEAEAKAAAEAEAKNEQAFEDFAGEKQKEGLTDTVDYQNFTEAYHLRERASPLMKLANQIHGYGQNGLYHDNIRLDKISSFKVQHMYFRKQAPNHPHMKFNFAEDDLMDSVCQMEPIYYRRSTKNDVVFRAGDYRSTLDDKEMSRASNAREEALELNHMLLSAYGS